MASITSLSADDIRKSFSEKAIYSVNDPVVGKRVEGMQKRGMAIESSDGLDFCQQNVFGDVVS